MADASTDPVAAYLADVRARSEQPLTHVGSLPISHDGVRELMASAGDVPRLVAAVEAALALHRAAGEDSGFCEQDGFVWPCPTCQAITAKLLGEESGRG